MKTFRLDCGGLIYSEVLALQKRLLENGVESNISGGSLCVFSQREEFKTEFPDLAQRILHEGESAFAEDFRAAARQEKW